MPTSAPSSAPSAVARSDAELANRVNLLKLRVRELSDAFIQHKWSRLRDEQEGYAQVVEVQVALMDRLRQIYTLAKRMTKTMLPDSLAEME